MDLALNNLQKLICHKTQLTNQLTNLPLFSKMLLLFLSKDTSESFNNQNGYY